MIQDLKAYEPFLVSANVRDRFSPEGLSVDEGVGQVGDLVLGELIPAPNQPVTVFDQALRNHRVSDPTRVVAILGTRLSSTHVNAGIPPEGLGIVHGTEAHWISGESGMVGRLFFEADPDGPFKAETSVRFRCLGLLKTPGGARLNIEDLAIGHRAKALTAPLLLVGATVAEAGKTVLSRKIIQHLVMRGKRVAAIKVTGTGGTMDSSEHRAGGAFLTLDQVDAGLITTYCDSDLFEGRIMRSFLAAQDHDPDIILAELGGDLTFANNPTFLRMPEVRARIRGMVVISSDPLSCYGVSRYLREELELEPPLVRHFASPFRNPAGMKVRARVMGVEELFDPNDEEEIGAVVDGCLGEADT